MITSSPLSDAQREHIGQELWFQQAASNSASQAKHLENQVNHLQTQLLDVTEELSTAETTIKQLQAQLAQRDQLVATVEGQLVLYKEESNNNLQVL